MIIVSGPPRSGTTFVQWFLSQHPRIHIHGQEPHVSFSEWFGWFDSMIESAKWSVKSNKSKDVKSYQVKHYSGCSPAKCHHIFREMFKNFMTGHGPSKPRWGAKFLWCVSNPKVTVRFEELWPDLKWVVCIRDPFLSFNSQKNTFVKKQDLEEWIERWIGCADFVMNNDCALIQMDKLNYASEEERMTKLNDVLHFIGEGPSRETDSFIKSWPTVHKVRSDKDRKFQVSEKRKREMHSKYPKLLPLMKNLGY